MDTPATGMADFITALQTNLTIDALWGALTNIAALIGTLVVFAFSYRVIKHLIGGAARGSARV